MKGHRTQEQTTETMDLVLHSNAMVGFVEARLKCRTPWSVEKTKHKETNKQTKEKQIALQYRKHHAFIETGNP